MDISDIELFSKIVLIRGQKVLLDEDLANLYGVKTKVLNQAIRRNIERFPADFMFQLTDNEYGNLRSQIVTSNRGGRKYLPFAFTEQGVAMLSSVLRSKTAIAVNIQIMRVFVSMRKALLDYSEILEKIESLEKSQLDQDDLIGRIYSLIKELLEPVYKDRPTIGFKIHYD